MLDNNHSHPTELFARSWNPIDLHIFDYDELMPYESRFVTLKRQSPGDAVTIQITTDPNLSVPPITIEPEPKPRDCGPATISTDDAKQPLSKEFRDIAIDDPHYFIFDNNKQPSREGSGVSFRVQEDLAQYLPSDTDPKTVLITNTRCARSGTPADFMDFTYPIDKFPPNTCCRGWVDNVIAPDGLVATCRGWWQDPGRKIQMTIYYQKTVFKCTEHDWEFKNGKWR